MAQQQTSKAIDALRQARERVERELLNLEQKGYEGFLSTKEAMRKKIQRWRPEDMLISLSSCTSPAHDLLESHMSQMDLDMMPDLSMGTGGFAKKGQHAKKGYAKKGYAEKGRRG